MRALRSLSRIGGLLLFVLASSAGMLLADDLEQVQAALNEPILEAGLPLVEMKAFVEPRIVQPPRPVNRSQWTSQAEKLRRAILDDIVFRGTAASWRDAPVTVEWLDTIAGGPGYQIRKLRYEALPGMWIPALLYQPEKLSGRVPLALHVNGHDPKGKATEYKQHRSINLAKRGLLVLDIEWFGMGQLRTEGFAHGRMNQLELCGAGGLAPFYLAMSRALDIGLAHDNADPQRVVVSGLSGGGWQTILISSLDERVTLANPVAGYGSFHTNIAYGDMGDSEQAPTDLATLADYTHLTALRAPRPTLLTYNAKDDCCFQSGHTLEPLLNAAGPIFALFGARNELRSHVNHVPGTHNFEQENREQLYAMIGDYFFAGVKDYPRAEIASTAEAKTAEQLQVPLPEGNVDFHRLARSLAAGLPHDANLPTTRADALEWQRNRRRQLQQLLHLPHYEVTSSKNDTASEEQKSAALHRLKIGGHWTVPATGYASNATSPLAPVLLVSDSGRAARAAEVQQLLDAGHSVLAIDPLLLGESKVKAQDPDYVYPLFANSVGQRPLGIQAAQLAAVARWLHAKEQQEVMIVAVGPRASSAALCAAAVEPRSVCEVELVESLASFHELLERDVAVEAMPELFAFGLLSEFDVPQLVALAAPRPVRFRSPGDRTRRELAPLATWYTLFGVSFDPAR